MESNFDKFEDLLIQTGLQGVEYPWSFPTLYDAIENFLLAISYLGDGDQKILYKKLGVKGLVDLYFEANPSRKPEGLKT